MRFTVSAVLVCICAAGMAQTSNQVEVKARLEQVANSYTANNAFMGTVLVVSGDQVPLDKGYDMAVLEWKISNIPDTKFRLGSVTKQFTAALILLMQQDGKLNINDPVSKYLPDAPKAWEKITLANLLGHTSGIPNFTSFKEFGAWAASAHTWDEESHFSRTNRWTSSQEPNSRTAIRILKSWAESWKRSAARSTATFCASASSVRSA